MPKKTQMKQIGDIITPQKALIYAKDPVRFVREVIFNVEWKAFGGKYEITDQQVEILKSVSDNKGTSVRAGRGIGKSAATAWIIIWWLCIYGDTKVVATAPSFPQLQSVLWPEVKRWLDISLVKNCFTWTKTRMYRNDNEMSFAEPRTASREEAAQGLHNKNLLILADEASGIEDKILETLYASLTEANNKIILMFNPTRITGFAYDTHNANKEIWSTLAFSSENSERVDKDWLESMKKKYVHGSVIHDVYRVHVLGEFPSGDPSAFFSLEEVYAARDRKVEKKGSVEVGIDLAAEGDDECVFAPRWGYYIVTASDLGYNDYNPGELLSWGKTKAPETETKIWDGVTRLRQYTGYTGKLKLKIDAGGLGMPIIHHLEEKAVQYNVEIVRVNFGGSGKDYENADDEATYMWQNLKEIIELVQLPYDSFLLDELVSRRWGFAANGKQKIESKKIYKKEFKSSPDRADAVIMAFAHLENQRLYVSNYAAAEKRIELESYLIENSGDKYCGMYVSPTGIMSVVMATFNGRALGVYDTITGTVEEVLRNPYLRVHYMMMVGSKDIFSGGDDIGTRLHMSGLAVIPSYGYNEGGSISSIDAMSANGSFVVATECEEMKNQLKSWTVDQSPSKLKETHGLCKALCEIVSVLLPQHKAAFCVPDYSQEFTSHNRMIRERGYSHV